MHHPLSHMDNPQQYLDLSEEQGERFHQDILIMEKRFQGYCYGIMCDCPRQFYSRKSLQNYFMHSVKINRYICK